MTADEKYARYCDLVISHVEAGTFAKYIDVIAGTACEYRDLAGETINARVEADEAFQARLFDARLKFRMKGK